jgi:hypothetical protein
MKLLAIERENKGVSASDYQPILKSEAEKVWDLYQNDLIREIYYDKSRSSVILILECSDRDEAEKILLDLPLVKRGLIYFDIYVLGPYPGFSRLM